MPTLMEMLEAGVHFGHKKERSHPKSREFTYTLREGVYVIDLEKTLSELTKALDYLKTQANLGKIILFVGTKRQAKETVKKVAENVGMPYITHRWLGGTLTNFETIRKNITEMERLDLQTKSPEFESLTKKDKKGYASLDNSLIGDLTKKLDGKDCKDKYIKLNFKDDENL